MINAKGKESQKELRFGANKEECTLSIDSLIRSTKKILRTNKTLQVIALLFFTCIMLTLFELISGIVLQESDIVSDGFFNTFKSISFLLTCISILLNNFLSKDSDFLFERIELIAALSSVIFLVIVSVYMLLQALHLITDDETRQPPALFLKRLHVIKVFINMLALTYFSEYTVHPSIQIKLQLWKTSKVWKKLNSLSFEDLRNCRALIRKWDNHFENMNAMCASLISDLICSLFFVIFFYCGDMLHYAKAYMFISIINFSLVVLLTKPLFNSILQIFMQGKGIAFNEYYNFVSSKCINCSGCLGVKLSKFWMRAQNNLLVYLQVYSGKSIDRTALKNSIHDLGKEVGLQADVILQCQE